MSIASDMCAVTTNCGQFSQNEHLSVPFALIISVCWVLSVDCTLLVQPHSQLVVAGQKVSLHCGTSLNGSSVAWRHMAPGSLSANIVFSSYHPLPAGGVFSIDTAIGPGRADLVIDPVGLAQAGVYICRDNDGFSRESASAELVVLKSTRLNCNVSFQNKLDIGKAVTDCGAVWFECMIGYSSNIKPSVLWTTSGVVLSKNVSIAAELNFSANILTSYLLISLKPSDVTVYNVTVVFRKSFIVPNNNPQAGAIRMDHGGKSVVAASHSIANVTVNSSTVYNFTRSPDEIAQCADEGMLVTVNTWTEVVNVSYVARAELILHQAPTTSYFNARNSLQYLMDENSNGNVGPLSSSTVMLITISVCTVAVVVAVYVTLSIYKRVVAPERQSCSQPATFAESPGFESSFYGANNGGEYNDETQDRNPAYASFSDDGESVSNLRSMEETRRQLRDLFRETSDNKKPSKKPSSGYNDDDIDNWQTGTLAANLAYDYVNDSECSFADTDVFHQRVESTPGDYQRLTFARGDSQSSQNSGVDENLSLIHA
jgi:hypothetical protein